MPVFDKLSECSTMSPFAVEGRAEARDDGVARLGAYVKYHGLTVAWQRPRLDVKAVTKMIAPAKTRELVIARTMRDDVLNGSAMSPLQIRSSAPNRIP
jgi:hypothetical protein